MALNLENAAAKLAKVTRAAKGEGKKKQYIPVAKDDRFVISTQTMKSGDTKINGKIYDGDIASLLSPKGKLNTQFATLRKVNGELYLVAVTANQMAKIQGIQGKEVVAGNENAKLIVTEGSPAANKYAVGTELTNDLRRQLYTRTYGTKVKVSKGCLVFELPVNNLNLTSYGKLLGRDFIEVLSKKNMEFTVSESTTIDLSVKTTEVDTENKGKNVRYKSTTIPVTAWKLTAKAGKIVAGSDDVPTELTVKK
jgi:hypothetical protein